MIRRGLMVIIIVIGHNYPNLTIGIMIAILFIWILMVCKNQPHINKKSNILSSITDILIILILIVFIIIDKKYN